MLEMGQVGGDVGDLLDVLLYSLLGSLQCNHFMLLLSNLFIGRLINPSDILPANQMEVRPYNRF